MATEADAAVWYDTVKKHSRSWPHPHIYLDPNTPKTICDALFAPEAAAAPPAGPPTKGSWAFFPQEIRQQIITDLLRNVVADGQTHGKGPEILRTITQISYTFCQEDVLVPVKTILAELDEDYENIQAQLTAADLELTHFIQPIEFELEEGVAALKRKEMFRRRGDDLTVYVEKRKGPPLMAFRGRKIVDGMRLSSLGHPSRETWLLSEPWAKNVYASFLIGRVESKIWKFEVMRMDRESAIKRLVEIHQLAIADDPVTKTFEGRAPKAQLIWPKWGNQHDELEPSARQEKIIESCHLFFWPTERLKRGSLQMVPVI